MGRLLQKTVLIVAQTKEGTNVCCVGLQVCAVLLSSAQCCAPLKKNERMRQTKFSIARGRAADR